MRRLFVIAAREFAHHFRSRKFWVATFMVPLIFTVLMLIPAIYYHQVRANQDQVIGCVELDSTDYCQRLSERLAATPDRPNSTPEVLVEPITPDTSAALRDILQEQRETHWELDSLVEAYNKIQERRRYLFNRPESRTKTQLLSESYDELIATREKRDLTEIAHLQLQAQADSLVKKAVLAKADSLLNINRIAGYVLIDAGKFSRGIVEFHSRQPKNFLRTSVLEHALQVMLAEERLRRQEGITVSMIQELFQPLQIQEILREGSQRREFNVLVTYLAPVVAVLFLLIALFSATSFWYSSLISEKAQRIFGALFSSSYPWQLFSGKIVGLGLLGLFQILIWMAIVALLVLGRMLSLHQIAFLTLPHAGLFILYFGLGYLLFAALFLGAAAVTTDNPATHNFAQIIRVLLLAPLFLFPLVLLAPNSMLVRFLSFIPLLTPTFMTLRIPLGEPPLIDYYISGGIMAVAIVLAFFFAGKLFRAAGLRYTSKFSLQSIAELLQGK